MRLPILEEKIYLPLWSRIFTESLPRGKGHQVEPNGRIVTVTSSSSSRSSFVKKKAGLCLLRIYRKFPELLQIKDWAHDIVNVMDDDNLGVVNSAVCLITALAQTYPDFTSGCVTKAITKLNSVRPLDAARRRKL